MDMAELLSCHLLMLVIILFSHGDYNAGHAYGVSDKCPILSNCWSMINGVELALNYFIYDMNCR